MVLRGMILLVMIIRWLLFFDIDIDTTFVDVYTMRIAMEEIV